MASHHTFAKSKILACPANPQLLAMALKTSISMSSPPPSPGPYYSFLPPWPCYFPCTFPPHSSSSYHGSLQSQLIKKAILNLPIWNRILHSHFNFNFCPVLVFFISIYYSMLYIYMLCAFCLLFFPLIWFLPLEYWLHCKLFFSLLWPLYLVQCLARGVLSQYLNNYMKNSSNQAGNY